MQTKEVITHTHTHTHTRLTALFPGLPRWAGTRKVKPIWILLKQETVSGSGISWDICKSAPHTRQITMPATHRTVFYRPDALPAAQPTASKNWRQTKHWRQKEVINLLVYDMLQTCATTVIHSIPNNGQHVIINILFSITIVNCNETAYLIQYLKTPY